ncbi:uncharacterized protein LOC110467176 [Mizuhopecten yessoensis]|uniref:Uncharacterized protein n=1 Tax=Mizuhopecten yessoensis TaxID=6573 RepID=A0A210PM99_MIZYE|nr:uncharacterized protein LOC110467176 [Mizuhopecten yessoensis]OWF37622.1 hypothetical protein KP79_PYT07911 [Mizuhopecten yessoensis]
MSAIYGQDPLSQFARTPGTADNQSWSPRQNSRWGEYDVLNEDGRDCRLSDGLLGFRSNFDCCHQAEVAGSHNPIDTFGNHRLPKPLEADYSGMETPRKTDRHVVCDPHVDVFPLHNPERKDENGDHVLPPSTRSAIEDTHRKLYCSSRYSSMYPVDVTSESDVNQTMCLDCVVPDESQPMSCPVFFIQPPCDRHSDGACSHVMDKFGSAPPEVLREADNDRESIYEPSFFSPMSLKRKMFDGEYDANQNFHNHLIQDVYRYRLPSIFHYTEGFESDQTVPDTMNHEVEKKDNEDITDGCSRFLRPAIPPTLIRDMVDLKMEMELAKRTQTLPENKLSNQRPLPSIDSWTEWPHEPKLSLPQKSRTQKRFNIEHPKTIPDLRDFKVYSKRVNFNGFNSSVFRG